MGNNPSLGQAQDGQQSRLTRSVGGSLRGPAAAGASGGGGVRRADRAALLFRSLDSAAAPSSTPGVAEGRADEGEEEIDEEAVEVSEDTGPLNIEEGKSPEHHAETKDPSRDDEDNKSFQDGGAGEVESRSTQSVAIGEKINESSVSGSRMGTLIATSPTSDPGYEGQLIYQALKTAADSSQPKHQDVPIRPPRYRSKDEPSKQTVPTVFKLFWPQQHNRPQPVEVSVGGSFNDWNLVPMVATRGNTHWCVILDLAVGSHQYKFKVDDQWIHNPREKTTPDGMGGFNNVISVDKSDFEVFEALDHDSRDVATRKRQRFASLGGAAAKYGQHHQHCDHASLDRDDIAGGIQYGQEIPTQEDYEELHFSSVAANFGGVGGGMYGAGGSCGVPGGLSRTGGPPVLPPHLLQVILNKDTPLSCEPTLLPKPNHVLLNHMYALSIKDRVMVMSATQRFRKKYVTTILYRPIDP